MVKSIKLFAIGLACVAVVSAVVNSSHSGFVASSPSAQPRTRPVNAGQYSTEMTAAHVDHLPSELELSGAGDAALACVARSNPHFEAIYAVPFATPDRSAEVVPQLQAAVREANSHLASAAKAAGGKARFKAACDRKGEILTHVASLPNAYYGTFGAIRAELAEQGFDKSLTKYLIFYDGCTLPCPAGQASLHDDSRPGRKNLNNTGPSYAINFGGQDRTPSGFLILHEAGHTLGAVQLDAPHADGGYHCTDAPDVLCGFVDVEGHDLDGSGCGAPLDYVDELGNYPWDCGGDDYFNPRPKKNSYLDTHFNIATDSIFISRR